MSVVVILHNQICDKRAIPGMLNCAIGFISTNPPITTSIQFTRYLSLFGHISFLHRHNLWHA